MNSYSDPEKKQESNEEVKENNSVTGASEEENVLEKDGHHKQHLHFKVLEEDGSLGELPDNQIPGAYSYR